MRGGARRSLWLITLHALPTFLVIPTLWSPTAAAYYNPEYHYTIEAPPGWKQVEFADYSVDPYFGPMFVGPDIPISDAHFFVLSFAEPNATNNVSYLLELASHYLSILTRHQGYVTVVAPAQAQIIGGRPSADFAMRSCVGDLCRIRYVVLFASEVHRLGYELSFTTGDSLYPEYKPKWDSVADSFRVTDELFNPPHPLLIAALGGGFVLVFTVTAVVLRIQGRRPPEPPPNPPRSQVVLARSPGQEGSGEPGPSESPPPPPND